MKTLNEIWAAHARCLMRANAMLYRACICPQDQRTLSERGRMGVAALTWAMHQRDDARSWEAAEKRVEEKC